MVLAGGEPGTDLLAQRFGEAAVRHVEMPRALARRSRMVPSRAMRNARKLVVPQSTPIMNRSPYASSDASSAALPPAAAVLMDTTRSSANR